LPFACIAIARSGSLSETGLLFGVPRNFKHHVLGVLDRRFYLIIISFDAQNLVEIGFGGY
jgi:hypothetical protein